MRRLMGFACVVVGLTLLAAPGRADETLRLVTGNGYHPYTDAQLPYGGLGTMLVKAVFENMGRPTRIEFASWEDGYAGVLDGTYAATFPYIETEERQAEVLYSDPIFTVRPTVFTRANTLRVVSTVSDLRDLVMCKPADWAVDGYLSDWVDSGAIKMMEGTSVPDCFRRLDAGTVDFISVDRLLGTLTAQAVNEQAGWVRIGQLVKAGNSNHFIAARSNPRGPALIQAFNDSMAQLAQRGVKGQLVQRFFALTN